jgi:4-hydroxyphenylacetate 3-monooxygenase
MLNGKDYLESLKDGRDVYLNGEKIKDVTTHPAYRNSARSIARMYDTLHDKKQSEILTGETEFGDQTHKFFKTSKSAQDLLEARDAIAEWAKLSFGFMGRSPDYKAAFIGHLEGYADYFVGFEDNARAWYKKATKDVLFLNHTIINPQLDRSKALHENKDVFVRVVAEKDNGIIVSGAKMVGTSAALTNYNFVANYGTRDLGDGDLSHALIFFMPMNVKGVKIISRTSYELHAATNGSPFDYPLSSRFDENDSVIILDNVFIPWEDVLCYKNVEVSNGFYHAYSFINRLALHGCTRLAVKLDFMAGLLLKATEAAGSNNFRGVQAHIGEVVALRNTFWSLTTAMAADPEKGRNGVAVPNGFAATAYRVLAPQSWHRIKNIFEQAVAGALIMLPSSAKDFSNPDLRPHLDQYYRGTSINAEERVKLLKMVWDTIGTEFGGRHELYEQNYAGNSENIRIETLLHAQAVGAADNYKSFVDSALNDYDLNGWTNSTWVHNLKQEATR